MSDSEESSSSTSQSSHRSWVWNYFTQSPDKKTAKCEIKGCSSTLKCSGGSTTGLIKHLKIHGVTSSGKTLARGPMDNFTKGEFIFDQQKSRELLVKLIVSQDLPFTFTESQEFNDYVHSLRPEVKIYSGDTNRSDIDKLFEKEKEKVKTRLLNAPGKMSFTLDCWTSSSCLPFMGITCHFIDRMWNLNEIVIGFKLLEGPHTGSNLADVFEQTMTEFSIDKAFAITSDSASNNHTLSKELEKKNIWTVLTCWHV